jgi:hypothetical protein
MGRSAARVLPVFVGGKAQHLILVRINSMTLAVLASIHLSFSELVPYIEHFECSLEEDAFQFPKEVRTDQHDVSNRIGIIIGSTGAVDLAETFYWARHLGFPIP